MSAFDYSGYVYRNGLRVNTLYTEMGDSSIRVRLFPSCVTIRRNGEVIDENLFLEKGTPPEAFFDAEDDETPQLDPDYFRESGKSCVFNVDGFRLEVFFTYEDNCYCYGKLVQPDGVIWHAWHGYGVGKRFEDGDYGYSNDDREATLRNLFPELSNPEWLNLVGLSDNKEKS